MKSVLLSIQPYYIFLIIARLMGWNIPEKKTEEVRKDLPKDAAWDKVVQMYCSRNRKSFARIPKQYQPFMAKLLGKVVGFFICDYIRKGRADNSAQAYCHNSPDETCLTDKELVLYAKCGKPLYFWHISALTVYETPKELADFKKPCEWRGTDEPNCFLCGKSGYTPDMKIDCCNVLLAPPQSWLYAEG